MTSLHLDASRLQFQCQTPIIDHFKWTNDYSAPGAYDSEMTESKDGTSTMEDGLLASLPTPARFDFPYPQPYDIQLDLMKTVFRAIEDRKIAIVGSFAAQDGFC